MRPVVSRLHLIVRELWPATKRCLSLRVHKARNSGKHLIVTGTHKSLIATIVIVKLDSEVENPKENQKMLVSVFFPSLLAFGYVCFDGISETSLLSNN